MDARAICAYANDMNAFVRLGHHHSLSLAELSCLALAGAPRVTGETAWFASEHSGEELMNILGGSSKAGKLLATVELHELSAERLAELLPAREGTSKLTFALRVEGGSAKDRGLFRKLPIALKRALAERTQRSIRWFQNDDGDVSSAAVEKLGLVDEGYDITLGIDGERVHVGLTSAVQTIDAWSLRDYGRPRRDARNGMLPPKLARMMVNIGAGAMHESANMRLLDPFCGGGTVLMEAALLNAHWEIFGSDIETKQIDDTQHNLAWMAHERLLSEARLERIHVRQADARRLQATSLPKIDLVVTEGYLGKPLQGHETRDMLQRQAMTLAELWRDTLVALREVQPVGGVIVGVWPHHETSHGRAQVALSREQLAEVGYERVHPLEAWQHTQKPLLYQREGQFVTREIVVLRKVS